MNTKHIVTATAFTRPWLEQLFSRAEQLVKEGYSPTLAGKIVATCFFEPSTRTRLSFTSAAQRLGANVLGFDSASSTSTSKGETLEDTTRMVGGYADTIVMRHPEEGSAKRAMAVSNVPVINAGDGANAHPTQTLVDLFAIKQAIGRLDDFTIVMVGDMKYSRVAHSLAWTLKLFNNVKQIWINPAELPMPDDVAEYITDAKIDSDYRPYLAEADVVLMTRVQQERFATKEEYERLKDTYILTAADVAKAKPTMKIISPLPRVNELPVELDTLPQAFYFKQAELAVPVRAALLEYVLGVWQ